MTEISLIVTLNNQFTFIFTFLSEFNYIRGNLRKPCHIWHKRVIQSKLIHYMYKWRFLPFTQGILEYHVMSCQPLTWNFGGINEQLSHIMPHARCRSEPLRRKGASSILYILESDTLYVWINLYSWNTFRNTSKLSVVCVFIFWYFPK